MPGTDVQLSGSQRRWAGRGPDDRRSKGEFILSQRNKGQKMVAIAHDLGVSEPTAYAWMKLALAARIAPTVDEYRAQQNDTLDERAAMLQQQIDACDAMLTAKDDEGNGPSANMVLSIMSARASYVALLLRLDERRAKLNGLDAPVRADVTVTHQDGEDAELQQIIRESQAKAAREKAGLT